MRVGLVAPPWVPVPPVGYGGTELVIDVLARGLVARGHEVLLFTTGDATCPVPRAWVLEAAEGWRMGLSVLELRHVVHAYRAVADCDLVHDHTVLGPLYAGRPAGLPIVTTNHSPFDGETVDLYRAAAAHAVVVAISRSQADSAGDVPIGRVILHGLDVDAITPGAGDGGYFLFLGRMAHDKGVAEAARAARAVGARLVIAAKMRDPDELAYFEREVVPLLGHGVEFVGEVGTERKFELLRGARALVNPIQWREPFGLVMVEALAAGTPVVAFPAGAAPEIVDHGVTGFLCGDEAELSEALGKVDDLDRAAARAAAVARFSMDRMVADHVALYEDVLAGRLRPTAAAEPDEVRRDRTGW
jgi:glycosyltransferase involved in cell wall biosynthesis